MNSFKDSLGILLMIVGAIILVLSYFLGWNNNNLVQVAGLLFVIGGIVVYVLTNKKNQESKD